MKVKETISSLTKVEWLIWLTSVTVIAGAYAISGKGGITEILAALIGVTALIFVAKGMVLGQALTVLFSLLYGFISLKAGYYGEMITYLGMTAPIAAASVVSWLRHPYKGTKVVEVAPLTGKRLLLLVLTASTVTIIFFFLLKALGNANLMVSTFSVFTSFLAAGLTFLRSPYYALGYSANDIILIALWISASRIDSSAFPMVSCFVMFLINDLYGFFNWRKLERQQNCK